jgi:uncharacterized protein YcaQ
MPGKEISLSQARRIALAAQGFDRQRPECEVNAGHIRRVIQRLGLLQLDYVNVLIPAHYLVVFSRLGAYDLSRFHKLVYQGRGFTEQWAHEASIVPVELWPVLEHRREDYRPYPNSPIMKLKAKSKYLSEVHEIINKTAPLTSQDLPLIDGPKRRPGDWHRSLPRWALEYHFGKGNVAVADRLRNFQRVYDLPERLIDDEHRERTMTRGEAQRALLERAAKALGIATLDDLADYYRMTPKIAAPRVQELVEDRILRKVEVEGWSTPAFLSRNTRLPRTIKGASLLSPFDPVVWYRPRAERLFDFHYRIEIYVPAGKRKWGYYVLPFLLDDRIVARVDLKADRKNKTLLVLASHPEEGIDEKRTIDEMSNELQHLARWLNLERIKVSRRGRFARALADEIKRRQR